MFCRFMDPPPPSGIAVAPNWLFLQDFEAGSYADLNFNANGNATIPSVPTIFASGANGPAGIINAFSGTHYLAINGPDNSPWTVMYSGQYGQANSYNGDFPVPSWPSVSSFTMSTAFYIPVSGPGAWQIPPTPGDIAFEWDASPTMVAGSIGDYAVEVCINLGVTSNGSANIYLSYGGDGALLLVYNTQYAQVVTNGWYLLTSSCVWSGNMTTDGAIRIVQVFNSAGQLLTNGGFPGYLVIPSNASAAGQCPSPLNGGVTPSVDVAGPGINTALYFQAGFAGGNLLIDQYGAYTGLPN